MRFGSATLIIGTYLKSCHSHTIGSLRVGVTKGSSSCREISHEPTLRNRATVLNCKASLGCRAEVTLFQSMTFLLRGLGSKSRAWVDGDGLAFSERTVAWGFGDSELKMCEERANRSSLWPYLFSKSSKRLVHPRQTQSLRAYAPSKACLQPTAMDGFWVLLDGDF